MAYGNTSVLMELNSLHTIDVIRTQGSDGNWIMFYNLYFSQNDIDWALYREDGVIRVSLKCLR